MIDEIKKRISHFVVLGFSRNSIYKYLYLKIFLRNKHVLALVFSLFLIIILNWFLWILKIGRSGFAIESNFNFLLNIPFIPKLYSLVFIISLMSLVNLFLAFMIYRKNSFLSFILIFTSIFLNVFILALSIFYIFSFNL